MRSFQLNIYLQYIIYFFLFGSPLGVTCVCVSVFNTRLLGRVKRRISRSPSTLFSIYCVCTFCFLSFFVEYIYIWDPSSIHTDAYIFIELVQIEGRNQFGTGWHCKLNHHHYTALWWSLSLDAAHQRAGWLAVSSPICLDQIFLLFSFYFILLFFYFFFRKRQRLFWKWAGCWKGEMRGREGARALLLS